MIKHNIAEKVVNSLSDLLNLCSVPISGSGNLLGSGFFVAPGKVLTCSHVIENFSQTPDRLTIHYANLNIPVASVLVDLPRPYPDLALLAIGVNDHPCVLLDDQAEPDDHLYTFGHTKEFPVGDSGTFELEGDRLMTENQQFLKFKAGEVIPGFSGSPLLDLDTGAVCGIVNQSRDKYGPTGGHAIPTDVILSKIPGLSEDNRQFHLNNATWNNFRAQLLEKMPHQTEALVSDRVEAAALYRFVEDLSEQRAENFEGRKKEIKQILSFLKRGQSVLICGLPGMGMSVLAAEIAAKFITNGAVLWLEAGYAPVENLIESLAAGLGARKDVRQISVSVRLVELRKLIGAASVSLVVVDNANLPEAIKRLKAAIPDATGLLVTSRERLAVLDKIVPLEELTITEALHLLAFHADQPGILRQPAAKALIELVGRHPLAVAISGARLKVDDLTPAQLVSEMSTAPHTVKLPELGKPGVEDLFNDSFYHLEHPSQNVLLAFGAFSAPRLSLSLLANYLGQPAEDIRPQINELYRRSWVQRKSGTDWCTLQNLVHSYVKSHLRLLQPQPVALTPCVLQYFVSNSKDHDLLEFDLPNLLSVASNVEPQGLVQIISWLVIGSYPQPDRPAYMDTHGHNVDFLKCMDKAIQETEAMGEPMHPLLHYFYGRRGDAHFDRGEYPQATERYTRSLELAVNPQRFAQLSAVLGKALAVQGDWASANSYFIRAYGQARRLKDMSICSSVLAQQTFAAGEANKFARARRLAIYQVRLNEKLVQAQPGPSIIYKLFESLINLGSAELDLARQQAGPYDRALEIHLRAEKLAIELDNDEMHAHALACLGEDYHYLGNRTEVERRLHQAVVIFHQTGMRREEIKYNHFLAENDYKPVKIEMFVSQGG